MMNFRRFSTNLLSDQRGATAITVALMFTTLFALLGAAVDTSRLMMARGKLQTALDTAAVAAVRDASTLNVQDEVTKFFNANFPSGYLGMTPGTITFSQSGNTYTFTVSSNLPQAIMPSIGMGSSSNTITVTTKVTTGSGSSGGPASEVALILDNSASMSQIVSGSNSRLEVMRTTVNSLLTRLSGKGSYISMVNFNDAVRVDPAQSNSWLQTPSSSTLPDFSSQSPSNYGRFDGCLSTKYAEVNTNYPTSNSDYLTNNDNAPSAGKFRQYIGPVDFHYYYNTPTFQNSESSYYYTTRTINYNYNPPQYSSPTTSPTYQQPKYGYNYETGTSTSGTFAPERYYGSISVRDTTLQPYIYTQTNRSGNSGTETAYYYDNRQYVSPYVYVYSNEYSSMTEMGSPQNYDYLRLTAYYYIFNQVEDRLISPNQRQLYDSTRNVQKRKIGFNGSYVYAMKVYMGYRPQSYAPMVTWDAYDDAGTRIATGSAPVSAVSGGNQSQGTSYAAEIFLPVPFRPFASVELTYPRFGGYVRNGSNNACAASPDYYYCQECHKIKNNNTQYQCQACSGGVCQDYQSLATVFDQYYGSYTSYDYYYIHSPVHHTALYTGCGALLKSKFMETDVNNIRNVLSNMVATGPARINVGLNWGWRTLSPKWRGLFNPSRTTLPADYNTGNTKVAVLMTQGDNFKNNARTQEDANGRYFDDNSFLSICQNMKNNGIRLYVIGVGVTDVATQTRLRTCASNAESYANITNPSDANAIIGNIADGIGTGGTGSLRLSQ